MKVYLLKNFVKGWFIGNFKPSLIQTKDFEIALKRYNRGDNEEGHSHRVATEYNLVVSGKFSFNGKIFEKDSIIKVDRNEFVEFECIEKGETVVVKVPSVLNDKYIKKEI